MTTEELNEITGNFEGWQFVSLSVGLLFLLIAILLFLRFSKNIKTQLYSYVTVGELGLGLFFLVLGFFRIYYFFRYGDDGTFNLLIISLIFSARPFLILAIPVSTIFALWLIASNIQLIRAEGFSPGNMFAFAFGMVVLAINAITFYAERNPIQFAISNAVKNIWYCLYCYFGCLFIAVVACALYAALHTPAYDKDYVLILGCKIRKDGSLYPIIRARVEKALDFVRDQERYNGKQAILVPTGGKGTDECLSEGEAMKKYLLLQGVPEDRILAETKSVNTRENMEFSRELIDDSDAKVAFSTTNFHVFRSGMLAEDIDWHLEGMGAGTVWYFWPNAFIREFVGLLASSWIGQIIMMIIVCVIAFTLTSFI